MINESGLLKDKVLEILHRPESIARGGVLLATLGQLLNNSGFDLKSALGGEKLGDFVLRALSGEVVIESDPKNPNIKKLKALEVSGSEGLQFLDPIESNVRYNRAVWGAFSSQVTQGCKRVIVLKPKPFYSDISNESETPVGHFDIDAAHFPEDNSPSAIAAAIDKWAADKRIPRSIVLHFSTERKSVSKDKLSLLERIASSISEQDQKRIQIPLDVAIKLMKAE